MSALPDTHKQALGWLRDRGGNGLIDQYGRVVAQGEKYKSGESAAVWLRLVTTGHVEGSGSGRLALTLAGQVEANRLPPTRRDQDPLASHRGPRMIDDDADDFA